jgi:hypothetical protein
MGTGDDICPEKSNCSFQIAWLAELKLVPGAVFLEGVIVRGIPAPISFPLNRVVDLPGQERSKFAEGAFWKKEGLGAEFPLNTPMDHSV